MWHLALQPLCSSGIQQPGASQRASWCKPHRAANNTAVQQHSREAAEGAKQQQPQQQPDEDEHEIQQPSLVQVQQLLRPQRQTASVHRRVPETADTGEVQEVQDILQQQQQQQQHQQQQQDQAPLDQQGHEQQQRRSQRQTTSQFRRPPLGALGQQGSQAQDVEQQQRSQQQLHEGGGQQRQQLSQQQQATVPPPQQQSGSSNDATANRQTAQPARPQMSLSLLQEPVVQENIRLRQDWLRVIEELDEEEQNDAEPADAQLQSSAAAEIQPGLPSGSAGDENNDEAEEDERGDSAHQLLSNVPPSATGHITAIIGNVEWMAERLQDSEILKVFQTLLTKHGQLFVSNQKLQREHKQLQNRWNSMSNTLGVAISSFQHELKGAEPLLGNSGREPGSRTDTASSYEQWELAAYRITAPSLGLFSQPEGVTEIWMLTLSPPDRSANAAPSADQAPLMLFVPKDALNLAGIPGDFKKLSTYTNLVSSACNVSCQRLHFVHPFWSSGLLFKF